MNPDLYRCPTCGASLSLDQLRGTDCPFCKTVFPHHARAVEQAKLVNQVMAQQAGWAAPQVPMQYGAPMPPTPGFGYADYGNGNGMVDRAVRRSISGIVISLVVGAVITVLAIVGVVVVLVLSR